MNTQSEQGAVVIAVHCCVRSSLGTKRAHCWESIYGMRSSHWWKWGKAVTWVAWNKSCCHCCKSCKGHTQKHTYLSKTKIDRKIICVVSLGNEVLQKSLVLFHFLKGTTPDHKKLCILLRPPMYFVYYLSHCGKKCAIQQFTSLNSKGIYFPI